MLSGKFVNCYGIKNFEMSEINFNNSNKAIIYAPNGVMKTSFANVFDDISKGLQTVDKLFKNEKSSYNINYWSSNYTNQNLSKNDRIYVIKSFDEKIELSKETMGTLLADEKTRKEYEILISKFANEVEEFKLNMSSLSGISKNNLDKFLKEQLNLSDSADFPDIFLKLEEFKNSNPLVEVLNDIKYVTIINDKTEDILKNKEFIGILDRYVDQLNSLISGNELLSKKFNDYNAEELGKNLKKHNLFENGHKILLKDGKEITTVEEWENELKIQLDILYLDNELADSFNQIKKKLSSNEQTRQLKSIIQDKKELIIYLKDLEKLKKLFIVNYLYNLDKDFSYYSDKIKNYSDKIKKLYETAAQQKERWQQVVEEFNRRFKVPFEVKIENQAGFLLKDEAPSLYFTYTRCFGMPDEQSVDSSKDELMSALSMGERRAMYLLYVLFDLEIIREKSSVTGAGKYLVIADDIADSFDYKNKYAIIEYLLDISKNSNVDLLILTHNFDFYRTTVSRLNVKRENCYIIQRKENEELTMGQFKYLNDYFAKCIVNEIKSGNIDSDKKKIKLVASIPFYRNLCEYTLLDTECLNLTCLLHIKEFPINTNEQKLSDIWNLISDNFKGKDINFVTDNDEQYIELVKRLAKLICSNNIEEVIIENKILLSIAIRLELEIFLKNILIINNISLACSSSQTREWSELAKPYLAYEQNILVDEVNLMTPESIHVNSFMYEPIIDMSDWALKKLYNEVSKLNS